MAMHANVLVAATAVSVVVSTALLAGHPVPLLAAVAAFTAAFAVYNFDRIADATEGDGTTSPQRAALVRRARGPIIVTVAVACVVTVGIAVVSGWAGALWVLAFPLGGVLYVAPVFAGRRLKDVPYLKSAYVPACWCTFVGQAAYLGAIELDAGLVAFTAFYFLRAFASGALGDLRDVEVDRAAGTRTFAVALGARRARWVVEAAHALSIAGLVLAARLGMLPVGATVLVLPAMFGYACFRSFLAAPEDSEFVLELYDLEVVAYAPLLWLAL